MAVSDIRIDTGSVQAIIDNLHSYEGKLHDAIWLVTDTVAKSMAKWAQDNAIWENQSGNARQGLHGDAFWENSNTIVCSLSHTMEYGVWLELAHERKYAILEKSIGQYQDELMNAWDKLVND